MSKDFGEILKDQATRCVGPLAPELGEIVAHASAHVNQKNIAVADLCTDETGYVVEADVHPARTPLVVSGHVVVELCGSLGVPLEELEEVEGCLEAELEGTVGTIRGILVACFLQVGWEGVDTCRDARGPEFEAGSVLLSSLVGSQMEDLQLTCMDRHRCSAPSSTR